MPAQAQADMIIGGKYYKRGQFITKGDQELINKQGVGAFKVTSVVKLRLATFAVRVANVARRNVLFAAAWYRNQVRRNIETPTATFGPSKPGEYLHRMTGRLHKSIFLRTRATTYAAIGEVGTNVQHKGFAYGQYWETEGDRSFLQRTLNENAATIRKMLVAPAKTLESIKS